MKQTAWEQSDWTYFFLFLPYHAARGPETRFGVGRVWARCRRARCVREVYISHGRAKRVGGGGFEATAAIRAEPGYAICTRMCLGATPAAAVRTHRRYRRARGGRFRHFDLTHEDARVKPLGATAYEGGGGAGVRSRSPCGGPWLGGLAPSKAKPGNPQHQKDN